MRKLKQEITLILELVGDFRPSQHEFPAKLQEFIAQIIHEIEYLQCDRDWSEAKVYTDYDESTPVEIRCTTLLGEIEGVE